MGPKQSVEKQAAQNIHAAAA